MIATLAHVRTWVAFVSALATLLLGTVLGAVANFADRWHGRRARRGDLAAVGIRHGKWFMGEMPIPMEQVDRDSWRDTREAVGFLVTVTNGSGEKITSVDFGIRWRSETPKYVPAGFVGVLLSGEKEAGTSWAPYDAADFEPREFDEDWLGRLDFYVRFTDQRGNRHENVLQHKPEPSWTSSKRA